MRINFFLTLSFKPTNLFITFFKKTKFIYYILNKDSCGFKDRYNRNVQKRNQYKYKYIYIEEMLKNFIKRIDININKYNNYFLLFKIYSFEYEKMELIEYVLQYFIDKNINFKYEIKYLIAHNGCRLKKEKSSKYKKKNKFNLNEI